MTPLSREDIANRLEHIIQRQESIIRWSQDCMRMIGDLGQRVTTLEYKTRQQGVMIRHLLAKLEPVNVTPPAELDDEPRASRR